MAVANLKLSNAAFDELMSNAGAKWDDGTADFAGVLLGAGYSRDASDTTYGDISANEIGDADYDPIEIANRTITVDGSQTQFSSDTADFGNAVTIEAKWFAIVAGDPASLQSGDIVIGIADLNDSGASATVSSTGDDFDVSPPATGYFYLTVT